MQGEKIVCQQRILIAKEIAPQSVLLWNCHKPTLDSGDVIKMEQFESAKGIIRGMRQTWRMYTLDTGVEMAIKLFKQSGYGDPIRVVVPIGHKDKGLDIPGIIISEHKNAPAIFVSAEHLHWME